MQWRKYLKMIGIIAATGGGSVFCWYSGYAWVSATILGVGAVCARWLQKEETVQVATISKEMFLSAIANPECSQVEIDPATGKVTYKTKPKK